MEELTTVADPIVEATLCNELAEADIAETMELTNVLRAFELPDRSLSFVFLARINDPIVLRVTVESASMAEMRVL